jgi:methionyl-tRNA formyltransferase
VLTKESPETYLVTPAKAGVHEPLKLVYFGTAAFAVPPLERLFALPNFEIVAVVTQPDRPAGRSQELRGTPVAECARQLGLRLFQPESLKDDAVVEMLRALEADVFVTAAYGQIVPQRVLDLPPLGSLNLHGSILPKYRGASPIQAAIAAGEPETGVTLMRMDAQVDHGEVYDVATATIAPDDTYATLEAKLAHVAADLIAADLPRIADGSLHPVPQDHSQATFTTIVHKADGEVHWAEQTATEIERKKRAYTPWPGIFMLLPRKGTEPFRVKLLDIAVDHATPTIAPGTSYVTPDGLPALRTKEGGLILKTVQPEGKGPMDGKAFQNGYLK